MSLKSLDIQKISKKIIHEVNALITYISPSFKSYSRTDFKVNIYNDRVILFWGLLKYLSDIYDIKFCE